MMRIRIRWRERLGVKQMVNMMKETNERQVDMLQMFEIKTLLKETDGGYCKRIMSKETKSTI